jgi:quercetin dioxygenase-like cupin family protein
MTTFIDTTQCPRVKLDGTRGEVAEIVNKELCGAEDVVGMLRWLGEGERFDAESLDHTHQLIYLMEGDGVITLENKGYKAGKGAGVYLGPGETAGVSPAGAATLKLLHLIVPVILEGR